MKQLHFHEILQVNGGTLSNSEAIAFTTLSSGLIGSAAGAYAFKTANVGLGAAIFSGLELSMGAFALYTGLGCAVVTLGAGLVTVGGKAAWDYLRE